MVDIAMRRSGKAADAAQFLTRTALALDEAHRGDPPPAVLDAKAVLLLTAGSSAAVAGDRPTALDLLDEADATPARVTRAHRRQEHSQNPGTSRESEPSRPGLGLCRGLLARYSFAGRGMLRQADVVTLLDSDTRTETGLPRPSLLRHGPFWRLSAATQFSRLPATLAPIAFIVLTTAHRGARTQPHACTGIQPQRIADTEPAPSDPDRWRPLETATPTGSTDHGSRITTHRWHLF
ncbi:hypothetical protein [Streptomyces sp. NPDC005953]|uniref:hypothetical protein n=1 Tax=Streptomyces sp. NPDC005953 TaxID=3156719 RepID=UPI0034088BCE